MIRHSVIIVAAGSSSRMGFDKLYADLAGAPVIQRTLAQFQACPEVDEIILVSSQAQLARLEALVAGGPFSKVARVIPGGAERQHSMAAGLAAVSPEAVVVAVHDGARPLVTPGDISRVLLKARETGAATLAHPVVETLKRTDAEGRIIEAVDRTHLWAMETPQAFHTALLRQASEAALASRLSATDEVTLVQQLGHPVALVTAGSLNLKITYPADLKTAAALLRA